ncbi:MAG: cobalt-precorrin 5A hydrolase [Nitrospirae bacterium]|nr:cobalt-precorrin 5A hydrolase [Nitrospirota bacterium]
MDSGSKTAIFYITNNGLNLAQRLRGLYPEAQIVKFKSETVSNIWNVCNNFVFIMATGIVVRTIAHLIKDKKTDPAVVVMDEKGEFAISLLSGHLGGANEIANEIAKFLGGEPVITAASDVNSMTSIDLWARENNLIIEDWELVPQIGTLLLNNDALRVYIEEKTEDRTQNIDIKLPEEFLKVSDPQFADVLITNKKEIGLNVIPAQAGIYQLYLRPKNLVVGIGCNSGTSANEIEDSVKNTLEKNNLSFLSIHSIATIDKKGNEPGLIAFAKKYSFEINTFTPDQLNTVKGILKSEAAFKATGVNAVAEPAALLASRTDKLIIPKQKTGNVTVAVAVKKSYKLTNKKLRNSKLDSSLVTRHSSLEGKLYIVGTGPGGI